MQISLGRVFGNVLGWFHRSPTSAGSIHVKAKFLPPVLKDFRLQVFNSSPSVHQDLILEKLTPELLVIKDSPLKLEQFTLQDALAMLKISAKNQTIHLKIEPHPSLLYFNLAIVKIAGADSGNMEFLAGFDLYSNQFLEPANIWGTLH